MNWRSFATGLIVGMVVGAFGFYGFAQWEAARHEAAVAECERLSMKRGQHRRSFVDPTFRR